MTRFSLTVLRNSSIGLAAQAVIKLLSFALSVLIIRHLGPEQYGQYAAVLAFGGVFVFLADLGLGPYTVRAVARVRDQPDGRAEVEHLFSNVLGLRLFLAVLTAGVIIGAAWLTHRPPEMIFAIALGTIGLVMYGAQGAAEALLSGYERLDIAAGARVSHQLAFVAFASAVLLLGGGYYGVIVANLLGILLMTSLCWQGVRRLGIQLHRMEPRRWLTLIKASIPFGVIGLTLGLSYKFDSVLLNIYFGDRQTGYYNAAYSLVFSAVMISNILNTALYPSLARQAVTAAGQLPSIYERAIRYLLVTSLPIAVGGWVLAAQIIPLLFEADYSPTIPALRWLCWVIPLMFMTEFLGYVILIDGQERRVAKAVMVSTLVNVVLNLLFVPRFGYLAAAVMTVVTELILLLQYVALLRAWVQQIDWRHAFLRPALAVCVMGGAVYMVQDRSLLVSVSVGTVVYGVMLVIFQVIGRSELGFIRALYGRSTRGAALPL